MYSDFYEIPLPALRFEKVEENRHYKVKNDTEENDAFQIDHVNTQKENDAWNKKSRNSLARDDTQSRNWTTLTRSEQRIWRSENQAIYYKRIKLTHSKNGRY